MLFNSFDFWLLFPFIFGIYWLIPKLYNRWRNLFLIIVSYLLYMNWKPAFAITLLGVTLITYMGGCLLDRQLDKKRKKYVCCCFVAIGFIPLLIFKYYNFLNDSIAFVLDTVGLHFALSGLNWAVPIGISFFTFQAVAYLLDVYHNRIPVEKNLWDYILFVSFFPQITSGPISKGSELLPQIKQPHTFHYEQGRDGLQLLLWGTFLKLCIGDRAGLYVGMVYGAFYAFSGINCFLASILYSIQIYCDFAGYSLMAVGIGKCLGFDLVNNFNRPYFADSITEFWKRWHISLTRWLTNHVYIVLGGNRCSCIRQYWNILITFLVSGIWHGANWTFVIWGCLHGILQIAEKWIGLDPKGKYANSSVVKHLKPLRIVTTFLLVNFAWIFFRLPTCADALAIIRKILTFEGGLAFSQMGVTVLIYLFICLIPLFVYEFLTEFRPSIVEKYAKITVVRWGVYIILSIMVLFVGVLNSGQFIYANF